MITTQIDHLDCLDWQEETARTRFLNELEQDAYMALTDAMEGWSEQHWARYTEVKRTRQAALNGRPFVVVAA